MHTEVKEGPPQSKKSKYASLQTVQPKAQHIPAVPNLLTIGSGSTTNCHPVPIATNGVYMGNYRTGIMGEDFNRKFSSGKK